MSGGCVLAIDQGTTNTKALMVGRDGQPMFRASAPVSIKSPKPGWVEQDAIELWESVVRVVTECLAWAAEHGCSADGVAISNQRETVVAWHRATGVPVAPAILWQCRRSAAICDELEAQRYGPMLRERTGLGIDPLFSASKMQWLLENVPGLREQASYGDICFGTVDSWLIWKLTRGVVHACDVSNASRTQLLNLKTAEWDDQLLALFQIPRAILPAVKPSSNSFGNCSGLHELRNVPLVSVIGDSHAAMAGQGCFVPGVVKATYGTGSSLMTLLPELSQATGQSKLATTIAWGVADAGVQYALEGNVSMAGSAVQWVGEFLGLPDSVKDTAELAASVENSDGIFFVPAMVGLGAPHWDNRARGTIAGLGRTTRAAHLAHAAIESIAFQVRDVFDAMLEELDSELPVLRADGGATRNDWLMQFQADILGRPVVRSSHEDLSALGAARLGGLTLGWWRSLADLEALPSETKTFVPRLQSGEREERYLGWKLAVRRARLQEAQP
jgi:glycerol kinase